MSCQQCRFWTKTGNEDSGIDWNAHESDIPGNNWHYVIGKCSHPESLHKRNNVPGWNKCYLFKHY
jgi:hypothetical protein